jgi:3-methyladenine DNA glycosylase AlkD
LSPSRASTIPTCAQLAGRVRALESQATPALRGLRRELSREVRGARASDVIRLARALVASGSPALRFLAHEMILNHDAARRSLHVREIERLAGELDSWGAVDIFACYLAGPAWRDGQIGDAVVLRWARSRDRWWRRAALVATVPLNSKAQGGGGDARRTLAVATRLIEDRDDMVVKAMSWALRELSKRDPESVLDFLDLHEERMASRVRREVRLKLTTGRKAGAVGIRRAKNGYRERA